MHVRTHHLLGGTESTQAINKESAAIWWMRQDPLQARTNELESMTCLHLLRVQTGELISVSHDDVTNIQLCIYRDTPKSARLSAVPSHSHVPHLLCTCVRVSNEERSSILPDSSYPMGTHSTLSGTSWPSKLPTVLSVGV